MTRTLRSLGLLLCAVVLALTGMTVSSPGVSMAATTTITIPQTNLSVGAHTFGPAAMSTTTTSATLSISRTAGGHSLNAAPASTTLNIDIQVSFDGGTTWTSMCSGLLGGGIAPDDFGNPETTANLSCTFFNEGSTNRQARAVLTVSGTQVSISGSLSYN